MIEVFRDEAGEWRFRVRGGNGEIVVTSEGYTRQADAIRGVGTLRDILRSTEELMPKVLG